MPLCTYLFFYPVQSFVEFYPSGHSNVCGSLLFVNIVNTLLGILEEYESGRICWEGCLNNTVLHYLYLSFYLSGCLKFWIQTHLVTNKQFVPTICKIVQLTRSDVIVGVEYDEGCHVVNI